MVHIFPIISGNCSSILYIYYVLIIKSHLLGIVFLLFISRISIQLQYHQVYFVLCSGINLCFNHFSCTIFYICQFRCILYLCAFNRFHLYCLSHSVLQFVLIYPSAKKLYKLRISEMHIIIYCANVLELEYQRVRLTL